MKSFIKSLTIAAILAVPAVSFAQSAQSNAPLTRAEVQAQIVQLEKAGYNPATASDVNYPTDIQAAEARVAAQNGAATGYGGAANGSSVSGKSAAVSPAMNDNVNSMYVGH